MVAKCVSLHAMHTLGVDLAPQQLGCGVPLGGEAVATRQNAGVPLGGEAVATRQNAGCFQLMQIHQCCIVVTTSSCHLKERSKMIPSAHCCFV